MTYNEKQEESFLDKSASEKFLSPIGLSINSEISHQYLNDNSKLTADEEKRHFMALHFCNYQIEKKSLSSYIKIRDAIISRIVNANFGLLNKCIQLSKFTSLSTTDMLSSGQFALFRAVQKFDPWRGYKFSTYAIKSMFLAFSHEAKQYKNKTNFEDNPKLDNFEYEENEIDLIEDLTKLNKVMQSGILNNTDVFILKNRFGICTNKKTLRELSKIINKTPESIRQDQNKALAKIRTVFNDRK